MTEQRGAGDDAEIIDRGLETIGGSRQWFQQRLADLKVAIHPASRLAQGLLALETLETIASTQEVKRFASPKEGQRWTLDAVGTDYLTKALHQGHVSKLRGFDDRWRALKSGDPILTGPAMQLGKTTRPRDFAWELLLASLVARFAPVERAEPDVVCVFNGERIGLAAKVSYAGSEGQFLDQIQEGARQIEAQDVDSGFVVVNMVEQFPHERMFQNFLDAGIGDPRVMYELVAGWADAFLYPYPPEEWTKHLRGMSKLLSVVMFVPTILPMVGVSSPVPYFRLHIYGIVGREERALPFEKALHSTCEDVLGFVAQADTN